MSAVTSFCRAVPGVYSYESHNIAPLHRLAGPNSAAARCSCGLAKAIGQQNAQTPLEHGEREMAAGQGVIALRLAGHLLSTWVRADESAGIAWNLLEMQRVAKKTVVFCGVGFMGQSVKIFIPEKSVYAAFSLLLYGNDRRRLF